MGNEERVWAVVAPTCTASGVELFDVELAPGLLRVTVERPGGLDLDALAAVSRAVSDALDAAGDATPDDRYELEVTTPGVERRLRRPAHFAAAVGVRVAVRTAPGTPGDRRFEGTVSAVDDDGVVVATAGGDRRLAFSDVERAHTLYDWRAALAEPRDPESGSRGRVPATTSERATTS